MRVLYSFDIFSKQIHGGISRYVVELVRHLPEDINPVIFAGLHINAHLDSIAAMGLRIPSLRYTNKIREKINSISQRIYANTLPPDIFHRTYYGPAFHSGSTPVVLTVYDMIHERYPEFYRDGGRLSALKRDNCNRADHIIAISHSTKRDLIDFFSIAPEKISVIHLASTETTASPVCRQVLNKSKPYIMFVGQRGDYKNFSSLLIAYARSTRIKHEFDFVCFGGGPTSQSEQQLIDSLDVGHSLHFVTGGDKYLRAYYEMAHLLVYPSFYEGFGLPVLEAMQSGCPVMCSASSSLPEVAGNAAVYINGDLPDQLEQLVFDDFRLSQLKYAGKVQAAQFSWSRCASETTAIYRLLAKC